jgi:hypothetical protein
VLSKARDIKAERVKAYKHTTSTIAGKELFSLEKEGKKQKRNKTQRSKNRM